MQLSKQDENELRGLLKGGIQQVRVVLRALALLQLSTGQTAGRVAKNVELTSKAIREIGRRYGEGGYLWDRFTVHYTPTHGSWLNQAEIEVTLFAR